MGAGESISKYQDGSFPLSPEELKDVKDNVQEEIKKYYYESEEKLKAYEFLKIDSEQKNFGFINQHRINLEKLELQNKMTSDLTNHVADLENKYGEISTKYRDLQTKYFEKEKHWNKEEQKLYCEKNTLENENLQLSELVNKQNSEIERLTADYKQIIQKLNDSNQLRIMALAATDEAKSELNIIQNRENRLKLQVEHLSSTIDKLNNELQQRFDEILNIRKEKSTQYIDVQAQLEDITSRANIAENSLEISKKMQSEQAEQIDAYINKLKQSREELAQLEDQFKGEIHAQEKLISLYKNSLSEESSKTAKLSEAVEEMQKLINKATNAFNSLRTEKEVIEQELNIKIDVQAKKLSELESELSTANQLLSSNRTKSPLELTDDEVEQISPAAAAASKMLKSGMTLTQIYSEYIHTLNSLQSSKDENRRLTEYLETLMKEIEDNAPLIQQQKSEYERSLNTIQNLTAQLTDSIEESKKISRRSDENHRRCNELLRENERYNRQVTDLSMQVKMLLKELEIERGGFVDTESSEHFTINERSQPSDAEVSSSSRLISSKLVTYRNIEELQEKNMQLLQVVRELSSESENKEQIEHDLKLEELQHKYDKVTSELNELRLARERQTQLVESIIQQRDMYRTIATLNQNNQHQTQSPHKSAPAASLSIASDVEKQVGDDDSKKLLEDARGIIKELREDFATYKLEKSKNEKILVEQLETTKKELSEFRLKSTKLAAHLEYSNERTKVLQGNIDAHKKEGDLLRERIQKSTDLITRHQQTIAILREEMKSNQEKSSQFEVRCNRLEAENDKLKLNETWIMRELDESRKDKLNRDSLIANLQSIQNSMDRSEFELKDKFMKQLETLEKENLLLRNKSDSSEEKQRAYVYNLEKQIAEANEKFDRYRMIEETLREQYSTAEEQINLSRQQIEELKSRLEISDQKLVERMNAEKGDLRGMDKEMSDLKMKLHHSTLNQKDLNEKLTITQEEANQYKCHMTMLENNFTEQQLASVAFIKSLENQLAIAQEGEIEYKEKVNRLEFEIQKLSQNNESIQFQLDEFQREKHLHDHQSNETDKSLQNELENIKQQLKQTEKERDVAVDKETQILQDLNRQSEEAKQAHENYKRELVLHASDVELVSELKVQIIELTANLQAEQDNVNDATTKLKTMQEVFETQKIDLKEKLENLKKQNFSLLTENQLLHDELQKMSMSLQQRNIHEQSEQSVVNLSSSFSEESPEKLLEIIRYLRREKEIVDTQLEGVDSELNRLRLQNETLRNKLSEAEKSIEKEKSTSQASFESAAKYAEMSRKIDTFNLLQDSNQLLRHERNSFLQKLDEFQQKIREMEQERETLHFQHQDAISSRDAAIRDADILREDVDRWRARTNQMIEKYNKFDPEDYKRALIENDVLTSNLNASNELIQNLRIDNEKLNNQVSTLTEQLESSKSNSNNNEAELEEKNKTILQLRKIGRKYKLQAEETQKELNDLKIQNASSETVVQVQQQLSNAKTEIAEEKEKLEKLRSELTEHNRMIDTLQSEKLNLMKQLKDNMIKDKTQLDQINKLNESNAELRNHIDKINKETNKIIEDSQNENKNISQELTHLKDEFDNSTKDILRLTEENVKVMEEKRELERKYGQTRQFLVNAKQKITQQNSDLEELRKQLQTSSAETDAAVAGADNAAINNLDKNAEHIAEINSLRQQLGDLENKIEEDATLTTASVLHLNEKLAEEIKAKSIAVEQVERLQNENIELNKRINLLQRHIDALQHKRATISLVPVERVAVTTGIQTVTSSASSVEMMQPQRRANIRPMTVPSREITQPFQMTSQQHQQQQQQQIPHIVATPLRQPSTVMFEMPARSQAASVPGTQMAETRPESRTIVSIRPMSALQPLHGSQTMTGAVTFTTSSTSSSLTAATPMATVMPIQESETSHPVIYISGRPTQQVQPVSSHFEESTVSSSEEQAQQDGGLIQPPSGLPTWWVDPVGPSTSSELPTHHGTASILTVLGPQTHQPHSKRLREDNRHEISQNENTEAPIKRSKIQIGEVSDTTQTMHQGAATASATVGAPSAELEREAASTAQPIELNRSPDEFQLSVDGRRDAEPVTTSLDEAKSHTHPTRPIQLNTNATMAGTSTISTMPVLPASGGEHRRSTEVTHQQVLEEADDLPDYQEESESSNGADPRPSTSARALDMTGVEAEAAIDDQEDEMEGEGEVQSDEVVEIAEEGGEMAEEPDDDDDDCDNDVICVDDDDEDINRRMQEETATTVGFNVPYIDERDMDNAIYQDDDIEYQDSGQLMISEMVGDYDEINEENVVGIITMDAESRQSVSDNQISSGNLRMIRHPGLTPFVFGAVSSEHNDEGIVPSTPTMSLLGNSINVTESINSPQIDSGFIFGAVSNANYVQSSSLALQRGVDDTRIDLSQFQPLPASYSVSDPLMGGERSADEVEQILNILGEDNLEDPIRGQYDDTDPILINAYEVGGLIDSPDPLTLEDERDQIDSATQSDYGTSNSVSVSSILERPSTQTTNTENQGQVKPKIQRIVWSEGSQQQQQQQQTATASSFVPSQAPTSSLVAPRRVAQGRATTVRPLAPQSAQRLPHGEGLGTQVARRGRTRGSQWRNI